MSFKKLMVTVLATAGVSLMAACASPPADRPAASAPAPVAAAPKAAPAAASPEAVSEAQAATLADKKFQEAARSYRKVEKDGKTMYCKKEKPMGSSVPRLQCVTEAQLRLEVEQMDETSDRLRNSGRCTHGAGCTGGG
jgi:hypothetical protein